MYLVKVHFELACQAVAGLAILQKGLVILGVEGNTWQVLDKMMST